MSIIHARSNIGRTEKHEKVKPLAIALRTKGSNFSYRRILECQEQFKNLHRVRSVKMAIGHSFDSERRAVMDSPPEDFEPASSRG
jgi:hypothetical protein